MDIVVKARHMEMKESIRNYVEGKVAKLPHFFDNITSIEVVLDSEADKAAVEIIVHAKRSNTFVASHRDDDMYAAVDQALQKVSEQLRRHKDKVRDRQGPSHSETMELGGK